MQNILRTLLVRAIVPPAMAVLMLWGCGDRVEREVTIAGGAGDGNAAEQAAGEENAGSVAAADTGTGGGGGVNTGGGSVSRSVTIALAWDAPSTYTNGTSLAVAGYKIYYGTSPGRYTWYINAGEATSYRISDLQPGTYYFATTVYDINGNESAYSNEASATIY